MSLHKPTSVIHLSLLRPSAFAAKVSWNVALDVLAAPPGKGAEAMFEARDEGKGKLLRSSTRFDLKQRK